ncbi:Hypothetical protein CINCED_3A008688 [Cinara cedri]|uniref:GAG-pre-integrase domain-containing protein n=1 Tax=Cinara cedri TaxID=506608 RepID=A0A5E4NT35_9HEMI|nr:Hypothetical protein CINCED_3A008688 [Cinara cedri]
MSNVPCAPDVTHKLMSVKRLEKNGLTVKFCEQKAQIYKTTDLFVERIRKDKRYDIIMSEKEQSEANLATTETTSSWHKRYGHISKPNLVRL